MQSFKEYVEYSINENLDWKDIGKKRKIAGRNWGKPAVKTQVTKIKVTMDKWGDSTPVNANAYFIEHKDGTGTIVIDVPSEMRVWSKLGQPMREIDRIRKELRSEMTQSKLNDLGMDFGD